MINFSRIWQNVKFKYQNKVYTKYNHNRGYYLDKEKNKVYIFLQKHTKVERV